MTQVATRLAFGFGNTRELQAVTDIVGDGAPGKQCVALEDVADIGCRLASDDRHPVDQDLAATRPDQGCDHVENRALAGAGGSQQRNELAAPNIERDVAYCLDGDPRELKGLVQCPDIDPTYIQRLIRRHGVPWVLSSQLAGLYPGYAFRATAAKSGLTTSAIVSGLIPVISRNQTFSPRAKLAASTTPS